MSIAKASNGKTVVPGGTVYRIHAPVYVSITSTPE
eukprot:SAG31_NODE_34914_length_328_cov_0.668122_1_plen_34_part_10